MKNYIYLPIPCCSRTFWYLLLQVYFWIEWLTLRHVLGDRFLLCPPWSGHSYYPSSQALPCSSGGFSSWAEELLASLLLHAYLFLYVLGIFSFNFCSFCERNLECAFKWKVLLCDWEHFTACLCPGHCTVDIGILSVFKWICTVHENWMWSVAEWFWHSFLVITYHYTAI